MLFDWDELDASNRSVMLLEEEWTLVWCGNLIGARIDGVKADRK